MRRLGPTARASQPRNGRGAYQTVERRWEAVAQRDSRADGQFLFAVTTTGVYCRPGCPAKTPRRENVRFFDSCAEAEQAGFRGCRRCDPAGASQRERHTRLVQKACEFIARSESDLSAPELAGLVGLSRHHFHRIFKEVLGITPGEYARACRRDRAHAALSSAASVTEAIYKSGYGSSRGFYEQTKATLGMTPTRYRAGAERMEIRFVTAPCSLGRVLVAATDNGVCSIALGDNDAILKAELRARFPKASIRTGDTQVRRWLRSIIRQADNPHFVADVPLDIRCTAFQQRVYDALRRIPRGSTSTYTKIAEEIGAPAAVRAVAGACAANPVALLVPCHRVVRRNGALSGYRWGVKRKRLLLEKEQAPGKRSSERR